MKGKKVLNFLFMRSAFNQKNITSVGLVALFVAAYSTVSGHSVVIPPNVDSGATFGSVKDPSEQAGVVPANAEIPKPVGNGEERKAAQEVIGILPSLEEEARLREIGKRGRLLDPEMPEGDGEDNKAIDRSALVQGVKIRSQREDWMMQRSEKRKSDTLAAIEDRLDVPFRKKNKFRQSYGDPQ